MKIAEWISKVLITKLIIWGYVSIYLLNLINPHCTLMSKFPFGPQKLMQLCGQFTILKHEKKFLVSQTNHYNTINRFSSSPEIGQRTADG